MSEQEVRERVLEATEAGVIVERDGDDLWLHFAGPVTGLEVRASDDPDVAPPEEIVGTLPSGARLELPGLAATGRRFLTLSGMGPAPRIVAERRLQIDGAPNFRDLGGYETQDGRRVAWGHVYRSGSLAELTPEGVRRVADLGIALVCDFRTDAEAEAEPSVLSEATEVLRLPIIAPEVEPARIRKRFEEGDFAGLDAAFMQRAYVNMLESHAESFGEALRRVARAEAPTLVHCTAGKDRTGLASALLLSVLGVSDATVLADYALSEVYSWRHIRRASLSLLLAGIEPLTMRPVIGTDPAVLEGALAELRAKHGSVERYLTTAAGLEQAEIEALRTRLLR
ncbi:MAG: tyrosine-protein phosphatase [Myxococcota bacterium]|nr:tyrosine-protein phosphatase [Myxococcota bacterium]